MRHREWIAISGLIWLGIGMMLLYKGLHLIAQSDIQEKMATLWVAIGLLIGFFKGRFILAKTVRRVVLRIISLNLPIRLNEVYAPAYFLLIGGMMGLGVLFRFLPILQEFRGMIDIAIGSALVNGAILYFRAAKKLC